MVSTQDSESLECTAAVIFSTFYKIQNLLSHCELRVLQVDRNLEGVNCLPVARSQGYKLGGEEDGTT